MNKIAYGIAFGAVLAFASAASAATVSYSDSYSYAWSSTEATDWATTLDLTQFDTSLGTLQSVEIRLDGRMEGQALAENIGAAPTTAEMNLQAKITASIIGGSISVETLPGVTETFLLEGFDGYINFGGTSGLTTGWHNAAQSYSQEFTGADMGSFIGSGTVSFLLNAVGQSFLQAPGNFMSGVHTKAGATVSVTYIYQESASGITPVPLPASAPLLIGGLGLVGLLRRRKS